MSFTSFSFLLFVAITILIASFFSHQSWKKKLFLLLASYYFYATFDIRFCAILAFITVLNYAAGYAISRASTALGKKSLLALVIGVDLLILFGFKYFDFFLGSLASILGTGPLLDVASFLMPVGISFFIFQAMTYPLDLARGDVKRCDSLLDFAFFIAFFPQLLVGPIVRASYFLPQLAKGYEGLSPETRHSGYVLIMIGLIKKVAFADVIAAHLVDPAYASPDGLSPVFLLVATIGYSFQIYMDLSGYTDMARGLGRLFGYELPINFNRPYHALSISNFWQRWHITMSSFFRDYLYFGVGGSRRGNVYFNLMVTFIAIGLWHGAGWNFVLYGFCHGAMVGYERWRRIRRKRLGLTGLPESGIPYWWALFSTFAFVSLTRVLFRGDGLDGALSYFAAMGEWQNMANLPFSTLGLAALLGAIVLHIVPVWVRDAVIEKASRQGVLITAGALTCTILGLLMVAESGSGFIYFQF